MSPLHLLLHRCDTKADRVTDFDFAFYMRQRCDPFSEAHHADFTSLLVGCFALSAFVTSTPLPSLTLTRSTSSDLVSFRISARNTTYGRSDPATVMASKGHLATDEKHPLDKRIGLIAKTVQVDLTAKNTFSSTFGLNTHHHSQPRHAPSLLALGMTMGTDRSRTKLSTTAPQMASKE